MTDRRQKELSKSTSRTTYSSHRLAWIQYLVRLTTALRAGNEVRFGGSKKEDSMKNEGPTDGHSTRLLRVSDGGGGVLRSLVALRSGSGED